jgi:hypothetical protein
VAGVFGFHVLFPTYWTAAIDGVGRLTAISYDKINCQSSGADIVEKIRLRNGSECSRKRGL